VEEDIDVAQEVRQNLESHGHVVCGVAENDTQAFSLAASESPDLALVNTVLAQNTNGVNVASQLQKKFDIPVIYLSAVSDNDILDRAKRTNPYGYLIHPFNEMVLTASIEMALAKHSSEKAILSAKKEWEATFDNVADGIALVDIHCRFVRVNKSLAATLGVTPAEVIGKHCYELLHNSECTTDNCPQKRMIREGKEQRMEFFEPNLNGYFSMSVAPYFDAEGEVAGSTHVFHNITKRVENERQLAKAHGFLQTVLDTISDSVMVISADDYSIIMLNKAARIVYPDDELWKDKTQYCYQVSHGRTSPCSGEDHSCPVKSVRQTKKEMSVVHTHFRADGTSYKVELHAAPIFDQEGNVCGVVEVGRNIDERLRLEQEKHELLARLFKKQKDESIGTLAGGIAHDFNNLLMAVLGNAELLQMHFNKSGSGQLNELSGEIIHASEKMAKLTRQLLGYARGGKYLPRKIAVNEIIDRALKESEIVRSADINIAVDIAEEVWPVYADMEQIVQVFSNIISNAFEAMGDQGTFEVKVENVTRDAWICGVQDQHPGGDYVLLQFSDNGPGIEQSVLDKIFEPFFTTKFLGRGLGLAAADGIIKNHGGCIVVESAVGEGVTVNVFLPRCDQEQDAAADERMDAAIDSAATLLVVDDEKSVQGLLKKALERQGFTVLTADSGAEALSILAEQGEQISLMVLDCRMDDIEGRDVYRALKKTNNKMLVLFASGYDRETALLGVTLDKKDSFIQKPFQVTQLIARIKTMLSHQDAEDYEYVQ
jgi:PAS domain S-box-containing protein